MTLHSRFIAATFVLFVGIFALPHLGVLAVQCLALAFQTPETQLRNVVTTAVFSIVAALVSIVVVAASQAVGLGKPEEAIDWLEKAFADRSNGMVFLKVEPELDDLRSNPRFVTLQQKLNFPK